MKYFEQSLEEARGVVGILRDRSTTVLLEVTKAQAYPFDFFLVRHGVDLRVGR